MAKAEYPRVAWMEYFIRLSTGYEFANGLKAKGQLGEFHYVLTWHRAEFFPEKNFATLDDARAALEPLLEAWKVSAFLNVGPAAFRFEYGDCSVETSAADNAVTAEKQSRRRPMPPSNLTLVYDGYPPLPNGLAVDSCVRDVADHYFAAVSNLAALLLHTYAIVTRISVEHHGLGKAAAALNVSAACLTKMKQLATIRGIGVAARKFHPIHVPQALSTEEFIWITTMNAELLARCARRAAGMTPGPLLTKSI
jgi:hypothetical protein